MSHRTSPGGLIIYWSSFISHTEYPQDMFGEESVPKIFSGDRITVSVDTRKAVIDVASLEVSLPTFLSNAIKNYWLLIITRWPARRTPPSSRSFKQQLASSTRVLSHSSLISEHFGLSSSSKTDALDCWSEVKNLNQGKLKTRSPLQTQYQCSLVQCCVWLNIRMNYGNLPNFET